MYMYSGAVSYKLKIRLLHVFEKKRLNILSGRRGNDPSQVGHAHSPHGRTGEGQGADEREASVKVKVHRRIQHCRWSSETECDAETEKDSKKGGVVLGWYNFIKRDIYMLTNFSKGLKTVSRISILYFYIHNYF